MTVARESQALIASLGLHLLLLLLFVVLREPFLEPRASVLRLTLPVPGGSRGMAAAGAAPAAPAAGVVPDAAPAGAAPPNLVVPAAAAGPQPFQVPVVSRAVATSGDLLPAPGTALAGALTAYRSDVPPAPASDSAPAPAPPLPRVTRYGLPAVRRGSALPYPAELITRGIEAEVVMRVTVAQDGTVTGVEVVRSSGLSTVDAEVQQALRQYLFAASAAETVTGTMQVRYRLERGF